MRIALLLVTTTAAAFIYLTAQSLPANVASHFGPGGAANSYMPRPAYLALMLFAACVVPWLAVLQITFALRRPNARINMPHRDYWLAPERRPETIATITKWFTIFPIMLTLVLTAVHWLVVQANTTHPPHIAEGSVMLILAATLAITLIWLGIFYARFGTRNHG